MAQLSCTT